MARMGLILKEATVPLNDAGGNRQAQPRARFLRAEERIEQAFLGFGRYAFASVVDFENDDVHFRSMNGCTGGARAESYGACTIDGFRAVANEVYEHLLEMAAIGLEVQIGTGFEDQFDAT